MLKLTNIYKTFNPGTVNENNLFSDFSFEVSDNEFVAIIGSNGSGKTTLMNIISGDITPDSGDVLLNDKSILKTVNYKRARKMSRVFQNPSNGTCPTMTIFENLSIADNKGKPYGLTKGLNTKQKDFYCSQLEILGMGLENRLNTLAGRLSGGQRQALALIMATLSNPDILLLDEHTAALDPKSADTVMQLTNKLICDKKITALMITHNLRYAAEYGTRTVMMHEGNAIIDISGEEKKRRSVNDYLKVFNEISIECGN